MADRILVVDDEQNMRQLVKIHLANEGYEIDLAASGEEAIQKNLDEVYHVIILDIMMPRTDGWDVCRRLNRFDNSPGILMLTAKSNVEDRVKGLNLGADDYLVKPFAPEELAARVRSLLRRTGNGKKKEDGKIQAGEMVIIENTRDVTVAGQLVDLTPKEFDILYLLASHPQRVYTRENLMEQIWPVNESHDPRTIDTHVKNIRTKVKTKGLTFHPIKTVWGIGYRFHQPEGL
ncbi:response regulator transcription factor [Alteribacillus sp. HJP-4]|uniref:response regulator transcription factor n=1 Tax=Alteribacillus sp. HJP-4 TaxID=2775394 RepID=UPI0035CD2712